MSTLSSLLAKLAAVDANTPPATLHDIMKQVDAVSTTAVVYDSSSLLPVDSAFHGSVLTTADSGTFVYDGNEWSVLQGVYVPPPPPPIPTWQGTVAGFTSGGNLSGSVVTNTIQTHSYASDGNATNYSTLSTGYWGSAGSSSESTDNGYQIAGRNGTVNTSNAQRFSMVSAGTTTPVTTIGTARLYLSATQSLDYAYAAGGNQPTAANPATTNFINKFAFAAEIPQSSHGTLSVARYGLSGTASTTHGYASGGLDNVGANIAFTNEKYAFANNSTATSIGLLAVKRYGPAGCSSTYGNGYAHGGQNAPGTYARQNTIDKWPFAADGDATTVGTLGVELNFSAGTSSATHGYIAGGYTGPSGTYVNNISKFSFTTESNTADVGDLTQATADVAGQQY